MKKWCSYAFILHPSAFILLFSSGPRIGRCACRAVAAEDAIGPCQGTRTSEPPRAPVHAGGPNAVGFCTTRCCTLQAAFALSRCSLSDRGWLARPAVFLGTCLSKLDSSRALRISPEQRVVGEAGVEPATFGLKIRCSTNELFTVPSPGRSDAVHGTRPANACADRKRRQPTRAEDCKQNVR